MLRKIGRFAVPLAAIAVLTMASASRADTITYSTSGVFNVDPMLSPDLGDGSTTLKTSDGAVQLTFYGKSSTVSGTLPTTIDLGMFILTATGDGQFDADDQFELTITQTDPASPNGVTTTNISGNVQYDTTSSSASLPTLSFAPNPLTIGGISYTLLNFQLQGDFPSTGLIGGTLSASVAAVPLPAAAWAGMALFGVLGVPKLRRWGQSSDEL